MKIVFFLIIPIMFGGVIFNAYGDSVEDMLADFSSVLETDPENMTALDGKATILGNLECKFYTDCPPLEAIQIVEKMLEIDPNNEELKLKRNFLYSQIRLFDMNEINDEYLVHVQLIVRDKNGTLVSVIENSGTDISPTNMLETHLNEKEKEPGNNYKKDIVKIGQDDYIRWHYEIQKSLSEAERKFFGKIKSSEIVPDGYEPSPHGPIEMSLQIILISSIFPAINVDEGDQTLRIIEVLKKI
jgi:hypothetical protein